VYVIVGWIKLDKIQQFFFLQPCMPATTFQQHQPSNQAALEELLSEVVMKNEKSSATTETEYILLILP
jgi:hypothetical protein